MPPDRGGRALVHVCFLVTPVTFPVGIRLTCSRGGTPATPLAKLIFYGRKNKIQSSSK